MFSIDTKPSSLPPQVIMSAKIGDHTSEYSDCAVSFDLTSPESKDNGPRLGQLSFQRRRAMDTPHYLALSSRGTVPHVSQDMMRDHSGIRGLYVALEDCESFYIEV